MPSFCPSTCIRSGFGRRIRLLARPCLAVMAAASLVPAAFGMEDPAGGPPAEGPEPAVETKAPVGPAQSFYQQLMAIAQADPGVQAAQAAYDQALATLRASDLAGDATSQDRAAAAANVAAARETLTTLRLDAFGAALREMADRAFPAHAQLHSSGR
jgi:hypothetical protein